MFNFEVLELYEITPFSNPSELFQDPVFGFGAIRNYTILKLKMSTFTENQCFGAIRNYTILKQILDDKLSGEVLELYEITPFSNGILATVEEEEFWSYTKLHHSQTTCVPDNVNKQVLELYEITPFSNCLLYDNRVWGVLELYEITPFSNP